MARDKDGKMLVTAEQAEDMKEKLRQSSNYDRMSPQKQEEFDKALDAAMENKVTITNENAASGTTSDEEDETVEDIQRTGPGENHNHEDDEDLER